MKNLIQHINLIFLISAMILGMGYANAQFILQGPNDSDQHNYRWFEATNSSIVLGTDPTFEVTQPGVYFAVYDGTQCGKNASTYFVVTYCTEPDNEVILDVSNSVPLGSNVSWNQPFSGDELMPLVLAGDIPTNYIATVDRAGCSTNLPGFVVVCMLRPFVLVDDLISTNGGLDVPVYDNDIDVPDTGVLTVSDPANGTVMVNDSGTPDDPSDDIITYTPDIGFSGDDTFTYTITVTNTDGTTLTDTATVTVTVISDDTDRDGIPDSVDIDDDNDGILDLDEDLNIDGDNDPSTNPTDTDLDTIPDYLDIDSDDDGIPDNVEAQPTIGYIAPDGVDSDGDGLQDVYEFGGDAGLTPVDTDGDGEPDYRDLDSDGDTVPDSIEAWDFDHNGVADITYVLSDKENDGLSDGYEGESTIDFDPNDEIDNPADQLPNTDAIGSDGEPETPYEVDYRDINDDGDDIPTAEEYDQNGDGIPDDEDGDGIPDYLDANNGFNIYNVLTLNGDEHHEYFEIEGIEDFPENTVRIFNRWGVLVYEASGYNNDEVSFRGLSEGRVTIARKKMLPTGTYYYILEYSKNGKGVSEAGFLYLKR